MRHAAAFALFGLAATAWTFPLARHLATHLVGDGIGDNALFPWNFWWMRQALAGAADPFHTTALFAPFGTSLVLHTHTALPAAVGGSLLAAASPIAAHNVVLILTVAANAFTAYLLAHRVTGGAFGASLIAGLVYGGSPFVATHLLGHLNLVGLWTLPLLAWATLEMLQRRTAWTGALTGVVLGLTAYLDYYLVVYGAVLVGVLVLAEASPWTLTPRPLTSSRRRLLVVLLGLLAVVLVVATSIDASGGYEWRIGRHVVQMRTTFNLQQAAWLLAVAAAVVRWAPTLARRPDAIVPARSLWRPAATAATAAVLIAVPLVWHAVAVVLAGEYATQQVRWRSSPPGIDAATLVLGNPNGWQGRTWVQALYARFGVDPIEGGLWLGAAPVLLAGWTSWRRTAPVRTWAAVAAVGLILALGPFLTVAGTTFGVVLPQAVLRYVPILSNARIPGRAAVLVYLGLAMLAALAVSSWRLTGRRRLAAVGLAAAAIAVDYLPTPLPVVEVATPAIYARLRDRPEPGAVCELPLGLRDGFGVRGRFAEHTLLHQMTHARPIVGGFVARLSPGLRARYEDDPLLRALLDLSETEPAMVTLPDAETAAESLDDHDIRFLVLDVAAASPELQAYVRDTLPTRLVDRGDGRELYLVDAE